MKESNPSRMGLLTSMRRELHWVRGTRGRSEVPRKRAPKTECAMQPNDQPAQTGKIIPGPWYRPGRPLLHTDHSITQIIPRGSP